MGKVNIYKALEFKELNGIAMMYDKQGKRIANKELTPTLVNSMIELIEIHNHDKSSEMV